MAEQYIVLICFVPPNMAHVASVHLSWRGPLGHGEPRCGYGGGFQWSLRAQRLQAGHGEHAIEMRRNAIVFRTIFFLFCSSLSRHGSLL